MDNVESRHFRGFMWAYIALGVVALVGGVVTLNFRITDVERTLFALDPNPGPVETEAQKQLNKIAEMRLLDSDADGLTDFDEDYTYGTSAYLADSDSDGVADAIEINTGEDPNCATGLVCNTTRTATAVTDVDSTSDTSTAAELLTDDPAALREQLIALGISKTVLDQVSDEDLIAVYSSVSADYGTTAEELIDPNANIATATANEDPYADLLPDTSNSNIASVYTYDDLQQLSTEEIRTLLLQSGFSSDELGQIDDATLQELYNQSLAEQAAATQ